MITNVEAHNTLRGLARRRAKQFETKTIQPTQLEEYKEKGWEELTKNKKSIQVRKEKVHGVWLEDRVWLLLYKMGFQLLSGIGGAKLTLNPKDENSPTSQIDVVGIDSEIAIAIECKSSLNYGARPQFQNELGKFVLLRESFIKSIHKNYSSDTKRQIVFAMFLNNIRLSDNDRERAKKENIILFDEHDLTYYASLISHLGPAAKYQVLADMLHGKEVPGLSIKVPAIKTKLGGDVCYNFSISPEYLLKIAYVSHRSKGKRSDINTYQRMLAKSRLKKISEYITNDGIFPTNIILNFEKRRLQFQKSSQETDNEILDAGTLGWLDIRPAYKSAWIIDGQHRLFAYSGNEKALKSKLSVLAFEGLPASKQAQMFIDINAKQKAVKQSLLQELYAELHWDAEEPDTRVKAIISKCIQDLNDDRESPLFQRIQTADGSKDAKRCITITSIFSQIEKRGFHIAKEKGGHIIEYGPLWGGDDNLKTLKRTALVLNFLFETIKNDNEDWWNKGSDIGGGLSMNDGVAACIDVLRSIFEWLEQKKNRRLVRLTDKELIDELSKYISALAKYLASLNEQQRKAFRDLRGAVGISSRARQCQAGIRGIISEFNPDGLDKWIDEQKLESNKKAKDIIDEIELTLQREIVEALKEEYSNDNDDWWYNGVPTKVRKSVSDKREEDGNKRGGREFYFDLIHYRVIIESNWSLFENVFGFGKGSKDKKTKWLEEINEMRKVVAHASSGKRISLEELVKLEEYQRWLNSQLAKIGDEGEVEA